MRRACGSSPSVRRMPANSSSDRVATNVAAVTPRDRVLVETDAPFLTPSPWRGRPNASYLVPHTVRAMAEVLHADLEELCRAVDANTEAAFGGSW